MAPPAAPNAAPSDVPSPDGTASLAGRPAGEGRPRPGRFVPPATDDTAQPEDSRTETATDQESSEGPAAVGREDEGVREEEAVAPDTAPASRPGVAPRMASESAAPLVDQRIPVLTLGVGLALMGLGIGFLGLRMRRR
ncbi:hypothetical protein [Streptomyces sp. NPDC056264]|uniref:hypothetical protein n=1 Tax=Streptomyces sp. NPDC056264 TaxID=3345767 RepID=UPI003AAA8CEA